MADRNKGKLPMIIESSENKGLPITMLRRSASERNPRNAGCCEMDRDSSGICLQLSLGGPYMQDHSLNINPVWARDLFLPLVRPVSMFLSPEAAAKQRAIKEEQRQRRNEARMRMRRKRRGMRGRVSSEEDKTPVPELILVEDDDANPSVLIEPPVQPKTGPRCPNSLKTTPQINSGIKRNHMKNARQLERGEASSANRGRPAPACKAKQRLPKRAETRTENPPVMQGTPPVTGYSNNWMQATDRERSERIMPRVTTRGIGRNARRIDGCLYSYQEGGHVVIICFCHGMRFTPAEFVQHAGGGNVANPMRHIRVSSASHHFY